MPEPTSDSLNAAIATALGIRKQFRCPDCDGREFGSVVTRVSDPTKWEIQCHDPRRLCMWRGTWAEIPWQRFDADWSAFGELVEALQRYLTSFKFAWNDEAVDWIAAVTAGSGLFHATATDMRCALALAVYKALPALGLAAGGEGTRC